MEECRAGCPASPLDDGFLRVMPDGSVRSDSSGVSGAEGPFTSSPPKTGELELKGSVSSGTELPSSPRPGWVYFAGRDGDYAGHFLKAGDALVCTGTNPAAWSPLSGSSGTEVDAARLYGTASVDTTGNAGSADRTNHALTLSGSGNAVSFDGSAGRTLSAGSGLSMSASGGTAVLSVSPSGVPAGTYHAVTVGADGRVTQGSNPSTLAGYGIADAYTRQEIDSRLTSGMHYRGSVPTQADLPSSGNVAGDFWNAADTGNSYAWDGSDWDYVGNLIDFVPITESYIDDVTEH